MQVECPDERLLLFAVQLRDELRLWLAEGALPSIGWSGPSNCVTAGESSTNSSVQHVVANFCLSCNLHDSACGLNGVHFVCGWSGSPLFRSKRVFAHDAGATCHSPLCTLGDSSSSLDMVETCSHLFFIFVRVQR